MSKGLICDSVVFVIGGLGLIGKELVKAIIRNGGIAVIADVDEKKFKDEGKEFLSHMNDGKCSFVELNITDKESINRAIGISTEKYGKIDAVINSAYPYNRNYGRPLEDIDYKDFCENINLHLGGYFLVSQQFAHFFRKQGYGNVINVASVYGIIAPRFDLYEGLDMNVPIEYVCVKSAIIHMTKYMAKYYAGTNIRFNCISPGGIINRQDEIFINRYKKYCLNKGLLSSGDIVGTVLFLLSDMSKYINGQNIIVDDGFTL